MENNNQKRIIFEGKKDPNDIIMEILESNDLKETLDDYLDKIDKEKEPWLDILYKSAKNLASGNITDKDFILLIQKQMNISDKTAENILKEIKQKLLPMARTLDKDEIEEESAEATLVQQINRPIPVAKILSQTKTEERNIPPLITPKISPTIKKNTQKIIEKTEIKQTPPRQQKRQNDTYREPIE